MPDPGPSFRLPTDDTIHFEPDYSVVLVLIMHSNDLGLELPELVDVYLA